MIASGEVLDGKYRIERLLGQGGMGRVYLATHLGTDRSVAVKVIAPRFVKNEEYIERFRREARAAGRLRHPNVVNVTDFGFAADAQGNLAYLVMEYLDGCTLADVLKQDGTLPLVRVTAILEQACSAVEEAHKQGIVHRDLKPENLWLEPDRRGGYTVKVLDFGLAKLAETQELGTYEPSAPADSEVREMETQPVPISTGTNPTPDLTRAGIVIGTPPYMSPEQCRGESPDARADIYSLGVIAYRMLAGSAPFTGDTLTVIQKHLHERPPDLSNFRRHIPKPVAALVHSALEKDPNKRPATAAAFASCFKARAESTTVFLQIVLTVISARLTQFLRFSLLSLSPMILFSVLLLTSDFLGIGARSEVGSGLVRIGFLFTFMLAVLINSAFSEPVVLQYLTAPERPVQFRLLLQGIRGRMRAYFVTMLQYLVLWPLYILVAYGMIITDGFGSIEVFFIFFILSLLFLAYLLRNIGAFIFAPQVVLLEGLRGKAALDRSKNLVKEAGKNLGRKFLASNFQTLILGTVAAVILANLFSWTKDILSPMQGYAPLGAFALLSVPVLMHVMPFFSVPLALLYFRIREAAGEPLDGILAQYSQRVLPADSRQFR